ncbi:MAG: carbohydrate kinase [Saprospiraceae bacterium]|nr:carbohydrate kinase [Saprospiraceae bacterium]
MIAILDIGKTNKKCLVFDADYRLVFEQTTALPETKDEEGEPCEDLALLRQWVLDSVRAIVQDPRFHIRAIHATTYGASWVHVDAAGEALTPLYNYLRPFPEELKKQFFERYGAEPTLALETASPILGNLNSGWQLYGLKYRNPLVFRQIKWSLHLPQYIGWLIRVALDSQAPPVWASEITSIGCHTLLWNMQQNDYHDWVKAEGLLEKFPPLQSAKTAMPGREGLPLTGIGLHDSSAALIPYLVCFEEPFLLLSTGTWCISLNPFNDEPLSAAELEQDCLCYLSYEGRPVKAARYFGGYDHEQGVRELAARFRVAEHFFQTLDPDEVSELAAAYRHLLGEIVEKQVRSTRLALGHSAVRRIFVDGGFSQNKLYLRLLAAALPELEVFSAEMPQATALGAALAIHATWNPNPLPQHLISLKKYEAP